MSKRLRCVNFLFIVFFLGVSCEKSNTDNNSNSNNPSTGVEYLFTITYDGTVYSIKGNTANDQGFQGPTVNKCIAQKAKFISLSITDVTNKNYVSGKPMSCNMNVVDNFVKGNNLMTVALSFVDFYKNKDACPGCNGGGDNRLPINITDLGTPSSGTLGSQNFVFGSTIKGSYSGTVYTVPAGSNKATVAHSLSINFICARQY